MDPGGWKSKWLTRGSAETKIQTSLVGLLVFSFAGLVSLLLSGEIFVKKRVNCPTFFNLVLIFSSPWADIDRHLFVVLWAFLLTVMGEQTERAMGKELAQWWGPNPLPSAASTHKSKVSTGHHVLLGATLELELSTSLVSGL